RLTNRARESLALGIMLIVARDFVTGSEGWNTNDLASELGLPAAALVPVLKRLEDAGLLRITEDERFLPGRSLDRIGLEEIASAVRGTGEIKLDRGSRSLQPAVDVMHDLDAAIHERLEGRSLRDLVETAGPGETGETEGTEQPA
ncbi:MAG: ribonuclease BN, partial [Gammaproteobacteria bacterium]